MRRSARGVTIEFAELSDPGLDPAKQVNEDGCLYAETPHGHLAVVCDGMGGHQGGSLASKTALARIVEGVQRAPAGAPPGEVLRSSIAAAGEVVHDLGRRIPIEARPGTTCVAILVYEGKAEIAHVGDSRLYLVRSAEIHQLTRDHSMVQQMLDAGVLSPAQAAGHPDANRITRALGMFPTVDVELRPSALPLAPGDVLLLCSDGLTDMLEDGDLLATIRETVASGPELVCQRLVDAANQKGGADNITAQVLIVTELAVVDKATVVDFAPTVTDSGPSPRAVEHAGPAPTLIDGPGRHVPAPGAQRMTQPWQGAPPEPAVVPAARLTLPALVISRASQWPRGRAMVLGAGLLTLLIVLGIALWWVLGSESDPPETEIPGPDGGLEPAPAVPNPSSRGRRDGVGEPPDGLGPRHGSGRHGRHRAPFGLPPPPSPSEAPPPDAPPAPVDSHPR